MVLVKRILQPSSSFRFVLYFLMIFVMTFVSIHLIRQSIYTRLHVPEIRYIDEKIEQTLTSKKTILLWTPYHHDETWYNSLKKSIDCNCIITRDRSLLKSAQLVVFHWRDLNENDLPRKYTGQLWIIYHNEPPPYTHRRRLMSEISAHINCWSSYRLDSDISTPYGHFIEKISTGNRSQTTFWSTKTKPVVWPVSNCDTNSRRENYVQQLRQYISVDIYGSCGTNVCLDQSMCMKNFERKYFFYLSFENSLCRDYITEKTFIPMAHDLLPVVFGGANYTKFLPRDSFINALDYSPRQLANLLKRLMSDEKEYRKYFKWKEKYAVKLCYLEDFFLKLDKFINQEKPICVKRDFANWWFEESCSSWS